MGRAFSAVGVSADFGGVPESRLTAANTAWRGRVLVYSLLHSRVRLLVGCRRGGPMPLRSTRDVLRVPHVHADKHPFVFCFRARAARILRVRCFQISRVWSSSHFEAANPDLPFRSAL